MLRFLAVTLSILLPTVSATGETTNPEAVLFSFAWPRGLEADVVYKKSIESIPESVGSLGGTWTYTMRVEEKGKKKLAIRLHDARMSANTGFETLDPEGQAHAFDELDVFLPDFIVKKTGDFIHIDGVRAMKRRLREIMPDKADKRRANNMTSTLFVNEVVGREWNALVGAWRDATLKQGVPYEYQNKEPVTFPARREVTMNYTVSYDAKIDCLRGSVTRKCAQLRVTSTADVDDLERMLDQLILRAGRETNKSKFHMRINEITSETILVTEYDGLIPHSFRSVERIDVTITEDGVTDSGARIERREIQFSYR